MATKEEIRQWCARMKALLGQYSNQTIRRADPALLAELNERLGVLAGLVDALEAHTGREHRRFRSVIDALDPKVVAQETTAEAADALVAEMLNTAQTLGRQVIEASDVLVRQQQAALDRVEALKAGAQRLEDRTRDGDFGSPPGGTLATAIAAARTGWTVVNAALARHDFDAVERLAVELEQRWVRVEQERTDAVAAVKSTHPDNFRYFEGWGAFARDDVLAHRCPAALRRQATDTLRAVDAYRQRSERAALALDPGSLTAEYNALKDRVTKLRADHKDFQNARDALDARWTQFGKTLAHLADRLRDAGQQRPALDAAFRLARDEVTAATASCEYDAANRALDACDAQVLGAYKALVIDAPPGKGSQRRTEVLAYLKEDPQFLRALAQAPGGDAFMDRLVKDIGSKARSDDDIRFVQEALQARFGLEEVTGKDQDVKSLPQLYSLLGMVPKSHTKDNDSLKRVRRDPDSKSASAYGPALKEITLTVKRVDETIRLGDYDDEVPKEIRPTVKPGEKINYFNHTVLHEIGHAVDDRLRLMDSKTGIAQYGGWRTHRVDEVAEVALTDKRLADDWYAYPRDALKAYLVQVLKGGDPQTQVATLTTDAADAQAIARHPAVAWCVGIRLTSKSSGLWDQGAAAHSLAIGTRIYQQAYDDKWVSYDAGARASGVSRYQFRAPAEWFAELYAMYYLKKLPEKHPSYSLIRTVDNL